MCGLIQDQICDFETDKYEIFGRSPQILSKELLDEGRTFLKVNVNGHEFKFCADCEADVSTINRSSWERLGAPTLAGWESSCTNVDGSDLRIKGYFDAYFTHEDKVGIEPFLAPGNDPPSCIRNRPVITRA